VVDRLRLERLDLLAFDGPAQTAIAFAARHTKSVSRLVLWGAQAHNRDNFGGQDRLQALLALAERDWDLAVESWTHATLGWARGQEAHQWAQYIRASIEQEDFLRIWRHIPGFDVTPLLSQVAAHTLVIEPAPSRRSSRMTHHSAVLASNIPDAQVVRLGPGSPAAYEHEEGMRLAEDFLRPEESAREVALPEGMTAIMFADIVDSTALTEEMGDAAFRAKARELDGSLRSIIRECSGTPVEGKVLGDGVLAVFTSARQAIECALRCNAASDSVDLRLHLGIHAGDVIREENNVYGGAVNIAARIAGASAPGEVLVSDTVRGLARTSAGVSFEDRGEQTLKGIAEPQRLFAVRARVG
jgi:class 3 adenylate cyclase